MMNERVNMQIDFVSANNGGLEFFAESAGIWVNVGWAKSVEECANIIAQNGLASQVSGSSSMDFASEYGFESDDAADILYRNAIKLSGV